MAHASKASPARLAAFATLLASVWLLLSGHYTALLLSCGALSVALVVWLSQRMRVIDHEGHPVHLTLRIPAYWLWLALEILKSAWGVARIILSRNPVRPAVRQVPMQQPSDLTRATLANAITLTPGTLSMTVNQDSIEVHALDPATLDDLAGGHFDRRAAALETKR